MFEESKPRLILLRKRIVNIKNCIKYTCSYLVCNDKESFIKLADLGLKK